jgi:hypothetical protein
LVILSSKTVNKTRDGSRVRLPFAKHKMLILRDNFNEEDNADSRSRE